MARNTVPSPDLLDAVAGRCRATADRDAAERTAAASRVWLVVQRLADGDASGGCDAAKFAADLDACNMTLADVRTVLDEIAQCRRAQAEHDLAGDRLTAAGTELVAANDALTAARAAFEDAETRCSRARAAHSDLGEARSRATSALDAARSAEASLRARGFGGAALVTQPLPLPPKPRRWEVTCELLPIGGRYLKRGSVVELPNDVVLAGNTARPVSINEPLREIVPQPGEPGGLSAVDEEMRGREVLA